MTERDGSSDTTSQPVKAVSIIFAFAAIIMVTQHFFPQLGRFCKVDRDHTLAELLIEQPGGQRGLPRDLTIEQRHVRWTAPPRTLLYQYPALQSSTRLLASREGSATCRVQDSQGRWWLAMLGSRAGSTGYILQDAASWEPIR